MDLRDYPRPKNDTGIGVHWSAGYPAVVGMGKIREYWLPELLAMGVKWVKIANHDGALEFATLLLKNDIMPIVRLYRPQPNPGVLDEKLLAVVRDFVAAGVRYLEFNNEPDLGTEWRTREVPSDAVTVVARNAIVDMEAILKLGGYPAVPALATGTKWDLVGEICRLGRRDLFAEPVWQAIHNYTLNHPLDYPYDAGNQQGAPYTADFYERLAAERWDGDAWRGRSLEQVNDERRRNANPGATALDDPSCWRAYERYDTLIRDQIGRSLPILATENGYIVGEQPDPRYPATTPQLHMAQTLEACRIMMGTSSRFDHAPDYYFCTAFWLLGNYSLGSWAREWESQAWYSSRWPDGRLPTIDALKAEPKQERRWRGEAGIAGRISGAVRGGAGLAVRAARGGSISADGWTLAAPVGADERYEFTDVPLDHYLISLPDAGKQQEIVLTRERPAAVANFDVTGLVLAATASVVRGTVRGGAGQRVLLSRPADGWSQEQIVAAGGAYSFAGLAAGAYTVALVGAGPQMEATASMSVVLDGRNEVVADLAAPGWGWEVSDGGSGPGFGVVRCRVKGRVDVPVRLWTVGWEGFTQRTGSKSEYGSDVCEFSPLSVGKYSLQPQGIDVAATMPAATMPVAEVVVDGRRVHWVTFIEQASKAAPAATGVITGKIGRPQGSTLAVSGRSLRLLQPPATAPVAQARSADDGTYGFEKLAAGLYTVQLLEAGQGSAVVVEKAGVKVDAGSRAQVDLTLPGAAATGLKAVVEDGGVGPGFCVVRCRVVGQPGRAVSLCTDGWGGITQVTGSKPEYGADACEFSPLGAGTYFIELEETDAAGARHTVRTEIKLAPNRVVWVRLEGGAAAQPPTAGEEPSAPVETTPVETTPSEPATPAEPAEPVTPRQNSVIGGAVFYPADLGLSSDGLQLVLTGPEEALPTTGRQTTVVNGQYAFFGLPAGAYRVAVLPGDPALGDLAVRENIILDGNNQATVDFELPAPEYNDVASKSSRVTGRAKGGAGRIVLLEGPLGDDVAGRVESLTAVVNQDEVYAFDGLGAGAYRATVLDTEPPTGSTQTQAGITLDGLNAVQVDFDLEASRPGKTVEHYLFVGSTARSKEDFLAILRYVARFRPMVGSDEAEARQARHVTILGGASVVSAMTEQGLRLSGCQVQRIESDYAVQIGKYLDEGRPY